MGKTTVGASLAIAATRNGSDVLLIELEGHSNLSSAFGIDELHYEELEIPVLGRGSGRLRARQISPDDALADYLQNAGLGSVSKRLTRTGAMEVVSTAAPGIRDLLTLGKIRQLEQAEAADLILVFDQGELVEAGPHQELVQAGGVYSGLHRAWIGNTRTDASV